MAPLLLWEQFRPAFGAAAVGPAGLYHRNLRRHSDKQLSSQIGAKGITKKIAMFVVIAFCHVLDAYLLHAEAALETVSTIFYLSNEGISILENVGKLGVPLPQKVQTLLSYLKKSGDNDPPS